MSAFFGAFRVRPLAQNCCRASRFNRLRLESRVHPCVVESAVTKVLLSFFVVVCTNCAGQPLTCTANGGLATPIRAEGLTELVGDYTITCTGGVPTPASVP